MAGVEVSVEAISECQIQEITFDGQETYVHPLSMSDNLSKLAHKIDFLQDESEEKGKPTSEVEKDEEEEEDKSSLQPALWPWHSVRTKLKSALTEMSVLCDVLLIAKEKHYLVLDPISQEAPDSKQSITALAKKRALTSAGSILTAGAERLRKSQDSIAKKNVPNFHYELLKMRQKFRLKKVGNTILGDLSYKSVGSQFWQSGTFEVTKSEIDVGDLKEGYCGVTRSPLQVSIPSELERVPYIQVAIRKTSTCRTDVFNTKLRLPHSPHRVLSPDAHWQHKLESAQNVIFCKEVFAQLAREAVQSNSCIPHLVVGDQLFSHLFPGIQLTIALYHGADKDSIMNDSEAQTTDHNQVLEHSLHQLVREMHFNNSYHPMPHPVTALLGVGKRRRYAGPHAYSRSTLLDLTHTHDGLHCVYRDSMLDQIIRQARHFVVRTQTMQVIDKLSQEITDVQIIPHWSNLNSATQSSLKVNITFTGYDIKTQFAIHIAVDSIRVVVKDGRVLQFSHDPQELRDFILTQVAHHHIALLNNLSKLMGWMLLSVNNHVGVGPMEPVGSAQSILIASPSAHRVLSVRSGPVSGVSVYLQYCPDQTPTLPVSLPVSLPDPNITHPDTKTPILGGPFYKIHLDKIEGKNFVNKMELIMACLVG